MNFHNSIWALSNFNWRKWESANLINPMTEEMSHCFQLSLTVEVNTPRNSMMITWKIVASSWRVQKYFTSNSKREEHPTKLITWSVIVNPIVPMNRLFFVTPPDMLNSSGFRTLNSLKIYNYESIFALLSLRGKKPESSYEMIWQWLRKKTKLRIHPITYCNIERIS